MATPTIENQKKPQDLAYYVTLFKIEGHETWRAHFGSTPGKFAQEWATPDTSKSGVRPKITAQKQVRIDRITSDLSIREEA